MLNAIEEDRMRKEKLFTRYFFFSKQEICTSAEGFHDRLFRVLVPAVDRSLTALEFNDLHETTVFNSGTEFDLPDSNVVESAREYAQQRNQIMVIVKTCLIRPITDTPDKYKIKLKS